jgi:protein TonB
MGYQALLFCPDEKAARGVTQVLTELDFTVEPCTEPFAAVKKLMAQHFDAIVVDCDNEQNATLLFKSARNSASNQSSLAVAVVEGQAGVAKAFRIGANLVLTKPINIEQAKGTLRVARGLLRKGGDPAKPAADPVASPASAPVPVSVSAPVPTAPKVSASSPRPAAPSVSPAAGASKAWPNPTKPAASTRTPQDDQPAASASSLVADTSSKVDAPPKIDISSKPAPKPSPTTSQPAAATKKYPWQASKPVGEPIASSLKKAAETAGIAPPPPLEHVPAVKTPTAAAPASSVSSAAAPARAKEKSQPVTSMPASFDPDTRVEPEPRIQADRPEPREKSFTETEIQPPSFSMGAPAVDEEEPASSKKALIIVAIVVILAGMAGYLAWKNMSGKAPAAPTSQMPAPAAAPATANGTDAAATSAPATSNQAVVVAEPTPAAPTAKPSAKMVARDSTSFVAPATRAPEPDATPAAPPAPAMVVHNETSRPATKPNSPESEAAAPAPSSLGLTPNADPKALAVIGNAPVAVPKASSQVLKVSQGVSEGLILKKVQPRYPSQALQMRMEGSVQLQATIGKDGSISNLKIMSGDALLARSAQDAVKQWKYKPYYLNGEPVEIQTQITINFKLPR